MGGAKNSITTKKLWEDPEYRRHMVEAHKGKIHKGSFKKGHSCKNTGRTRFKKGMVSPKKGIPLSPDIKMKLSKKLRGRVILKTRGANNWNWKGGTSRTEDKKIRQSIEYKTWRRAIFERDNFTCQDCLKRGGRLHADHIKPFALFPELRFELTNGRTLCQECHIKTPTYGGKIHKQYVRE